MLFPPLLSTVAPGVSGYYLEATWKPGGDGGLDYLTCNPKTHRLYVTRPDRVQVIDGDKGTLLGEVLGFAVWVGGGIIGFCYNIVGLPMIIVGAVYYFVGRKRTE